MTPKVFRGNRPRKMFLPQRTRSERQFLVDDDHARRERFTRRTSECRRGDCRQLQLTEEERMLVQRTHDDVVRASIGRHQHQRATNRGDGAGAHRSLAALRPPIQRNLQGMRQRSIEHVLAVWTNDIGAGERRIRRDALEPLAQSVRAACLESVVGLREELAPLHPRDLVPVLDRRAHGHGHRPGENEDDGEPERSEDAPV